MNVAQTTFAGVTMLTILFAWLTLEAVKLWPIPGWFLQGLGICFLVLLALFFWLILSVQLLKWIEKQAGVKQ